LTKCSEIRKSLNIKPLLLRIKRSQLRWFGHVSRMPQEKLHKQALLAKVKRKRLVGQPRTRWQDYIKELGWNCLGLQPSELLAVVADHDVWRLNLELLPPQPSRTWAGIERRRNPPLPSKSPNLLFTCRIISFRTKLKSSQQANAHLIDHCVLFGKMYQVLGTHLFVKLPQSGDSEVTFLVFESSCHLLLPV